MIPGKVLVIGLIFFIFFSFVSTVDCSDKSVIVDENIEVKDLDFRQVGHGLGGMRGGLVLDFDNPYPSGLGYNHEEVMKNINLVFGG